MSNAMEGGDGGRLPEERDWFTIPEAAAYLGISEPTLFRWMKDGAISFYKVGRATRFKQASLDAVVKKSTGELEAREAAAKCAACGHHELLEGQIQSSAPVFFRPSRTKFWTLQDANVRVQAKACAACGYIQLHADPKKLKELKQEDPER